MAKEQIEVTFIIGGRDFTLMFDVHIELIAAVERALAESRNTGQPLTNWEVRTLDGTVLDLHKSLEANGVVEGMKLVLSPQAGIGG